MWRAMLSGIVLVLGAVCVSVSSFAAEPAPATIPTVRLAVEADIAATPAAVWAQITHGKNLVTWCPEWKNSKNVAVDLTEVGRVLEYMDEWGNGGRSVVTYLVPQKEIRVAHEPNDGSYMCQARFVLTPTAAGTHVKYVEQYTDESPAKDREATAGKMTTEMQAAMAALRQGLEKH